MKSKLIAKTLGLIALASVAITAPIAHANDWQDDNRYGGYSDADDDRGYPMENLFIRLMLEQKNIRALERSFMGDRFMTEPEFRRLNRSLDLADRNIRIAQQSDHSRSSQRYPQRPWVGQ